MRKGNLNIPEKFLSKEILQTKVCKNCEIEKPLKSFDPQKLSDGSLGKGNKNCNTCRCVLARVRKYGIENRRYSPYLFSEETKQELKICSVCKIAKPLTDFYKSKSRKTKPSCKECEAISARKYKKKRVGKLKLYEKKRWANMSPEEKQKKRENCNRVWRNKTPEQKKEYYNKHRKSIIKSHLVRRRKIKNNDFSVPFTKFDIIKRDGLNCYLCNKLLTIETVTLDHIIPLVRGGHHKPENVKIACRGCNSSKHRKLLTEYKKIRGDYTRFQLKRLTTSLSSYSTKSL